MTRIRLFVLSLLGLAVFASPLTAGPKVDQADVDTAIDKGAEFLLSYMASNGQKVIPHMDHLNTKRDFNAEPLVLLTLIHAGAAQDDPRFQKIVENVLAMENQYTYETSVKAMALFELDPAGYQGHIADCAQFLVDTQCQNGQWTYGQKVPKTHESKGPAHVESEDGEEGKRKSSRKKNKTQALPTVRIKRRGQGPPTGDNSNSQYAALGLRAAIEAGCEVPKKTLALALGWWQKSQKPDGGWAYSTDLKDNVTYGSMTAGGIGAVVIYDHYLRKNYKSDPVWQKGVKWLAQNFQIESNPKHQMPLFYHYYYLYAVERAGIFSRAEKFGSNEWYPLGARWLLLQQAAEGSWKSPGQTSVKVKETCFAILFLRRATKPLPKVYSGPGRRNE